MAVDPSRSSSPPDAKKTSSKPPSKAPLPPRASPAPMTAAVVAAPRISSGGSSSGGGRRATPPTTTTAEVLLDCGAIFRTVEQLLRGARKSIWYSTFMCDLEHKLPGVGVSMRDLLMEAAEERGVHVHVLVNTETAYGLPSPQRFKQLLPSRRIKVSAVYGSGEMRIPFVSNNRYSNHHQKYLLVDDAAMLITGVDVSKDRSGWLLLNPDGYFWHETAVVVRPSKAVCKWVRQNSRRIVDPPFPLLNGGRTEHDLIVRLIQTATDYVHVEHQNFISTGHTVNAVARAIVERVHRAARHGETFHVMVLTNRENEDESAVVDNLLWATLTWSRRWIEKRAHQVGMTLETLYEHLFIGYLCHNRIHVKIHSNVFVADGRRMIRSSSNLSDRSLSPLPCDSELGIMVADAGVVETMQQAQWNRYFQTRDVTYDSATAFHAMTEELGCVRRVRYGGHRKELRRDMAAPSSFGADLGSRIFHAFPAAGAKKKIQWRIFPVSRRHGLRSEAGSRSTPPPSVYLYVALASAVVACTVLAVLYGRSSAHSSRLRDQVRSLSRVGRIE